MGCATPELARICLALVGLNAYFVSWAGSYAGEPGPYGLNAGRLKPNRTFFTMPWRSTEYSSDCRTASLSSGATFVFMRISHVSVPG